MQTHEWEATASEPHSIILKVEPVLSASLSATAQLICGSFTTDPVTMHHLMSYSHSPGHRILTTDVNCHLFTTMKDSGFLMWKTEPGRNHVKCVTENLEVTTMVFQCECACVCVYVCMCVCVCMCVRGVCVLFQHFNKTLHFNGVHSKQVHENL